MRWAITHLMRRYQHYWTAFSDFLFMSCEFHFRHIFFSRHFLHCAVFQPGRQRRRWWASFRHAEQPAAFQPVSFFRWCCQLSPASWLRLRRICAMIAPRHAIRVRTAAASFTPRIFCRRFQIAPFRAAPRDTPRFQPAASGWCYWYRDYFNSCREIAELTMTADDTPPRRHPHWDYFLIDIITATFSRLISPHYFIISTAWVFYWLPAAAEADRLTWAGETAFRGQPATAGQIASCASYFRAIICAFAAQRRIRQMKPPRRFLLSRFLRRPLMSRRHFRHADAAFARAFRWGYADDDIDTITDYWLHFCSNISFHCLSLRQYAIDFIFSRCFQLFAIRREACRSED